MPLLATKFHTFSNRCQKCFFKWFYIWGSLCQATPQFSNPQLLDHIFKLSKALYGLKQAPHACYDCLIKYFLDIGFTRGKVDTTLFVKPYNQDILLVQIYMDDIISWAINEKMCEEFATCMQNKFEMSI